MSTMTPEETDATLRALARVQLALLAKTVAQMPDAGDFAPPVAHLRRLLNEAEVIPLVQPTNVRRLVAVGTRGPRFGETLHAHVGAGGLKCGRTTAQEYAAADDEPPEVA